jgi:sulfonate transport system permease protein
MRRTRASAPRARRDSAALGWVLPVLVLLGIEALVAGGLISEAALPPPSRVALTLIELAHHDLHHHVTSSVMRVLGGFSAGAGVGLMIGAAVGLNRTAECFLDPTFQTLRAIPSLAWVPLMLLWLGIDEAPKLALIALGVFFPVYFTLVSGIRNIDRKLVEVGVANGLHRLAIVRRIMLPAALPSLFTGLRAGLAMAWMFLVAAELIAATRGIGYLLTDGRETGRPDIVLAAIVMLGGLGFLSDMALRAIERRALHWRDVFSAQDDAGTDHE